MPARLEERKRRGWRNGARRAVSRRARDADVARAAAGRARALRASRARVGIRRPRARRTQRYAALSVPQVARRTGTGALMRTMPPVQSASIGAFSESRNSTLAQFTCATPFAVALNTR